MEEKMAVSPQGEGKEVELLEKQIEDMKVRNNTLQKQLELVQQRYTSLATKTNKISVKVQLLMDDVNEAINAQKQLDDEINRKLKELPGPK